MIGAIAGDMIGSPYEWNPIKHKNFESEVSAFTDDTVLTVAVAIAILGDRNFAESIKRFAQRHPRAGYGGSFRKWMWTIENAPYNSFGNGSAMRVSPVGFAFDTVDDVLLYAKRSAEVTHNHPEGIKGAQATALAVFMARNGETKAAIRDEIIDRFGYDLHRSLDSIRPDYRFDISCQGSVPEAIIAFLESSSYVDAVINAISLGGDADTMACIAGGIAQAYYRQIPETIVERALQKLTPDLRQAVDRFTGAYSCPF